jgi:hypothetical protein
MVFDDLQNVQVERTRSAITYLFPSRRKKTGDTMGKAGLILSVDEVLFSIS